MSTTTRDRSTEPKAVVHAIPGMFKAITTKYIGPTDRRGARIKASDGDGNSLTQSYDYGASDGERHAQVAKALAEKMGWPGTLIGGSTKQGNVWVFVSVTELLRPEQVLLTCATREDAEWAHKKIAQQIGKEEQTLAGASASILRTSVQRAQKVEIGGAQ